MTPAARRRTTWESREDGSVGPDVSEASDGVALHAPEETAAPIRVELPWPDRRLHPNARNRHWSVLAGAAKKARADAGWAAKAAGLSKIEADAIHASITFHAPDNRRRDVDGMFASMKSAADGLADVVGVDDSRWTFTIRKAEPRPPHGAVVVEITEVAQ